MKKKPPIRYVDMCIYIDNNIYKEDADTEKIYDYLVMLAYMLASKRKFFNKESDYDKFAHFLAKNVYARFKDKRIDWHTKIDKQGNVIKNEDGTDKLFPPELTPIKSCLNYMKQILYARKCNYISEEFENSTNANDIANNYAFKKYMEASVYSANTGLFSCDIDLYFKTIDRVIKDEVYNGVYGNDKLLAWKLYTSLLISLTRNFKLSKRNKYKLIDIKATKENYKKTHKKKLILKSNYSDILCDIVSEETKTAPIVYDLDEEYLDYISVMVQKVKMRIIEDIHELSSQYEFSEDMLEDILMSGLNELEES